MVPLIILKVLIFLKCQRHFREIVPIQFGSINIRLTGRKLVIFLHNGQFPSISRKEIPGNIAILRSTSSTT